MPLHDLARTALDAAATSSQHISPIHLALSLLATYLVSYVVYYRYLHPLAGYPGPFWASLTNFWKVYECWTMALPSRMCDVHARYGPVVRIGPNDLMFNGGETIAPIYKAGRKMPKGVFYDSFVSTVPEIFSTRDENFHTMRLKQIGQGFSPAALKNMEPMFDRHIQNLMGSLEKHARNGTVLDLKQALAFYGYDVTGQLAFDHNFETQVMDDPDKMPPLNNHFFLGNIYGCVANLLPWVRNWTAWLPWVRKMIKSRIELTGIAAECIARGMQRHNDKAEPGTLLAALIGATNPDTGEKLTAEEINSESFLFLVAGAHTTSSALVVLLFHLLHNKEIFNKFIQEIDAVLPGQEYHVYPFKGLEASLPYGMACIREAFRIAPTAALLLPRVVTSPEGARIGQWHIPQGTNCAIVSTCLHHNPDIWGPSHNEYDPLRFVAGSERYNAMYHTYLLHFGQGNRQCIGRNIALMSIWKILVSVLKNYEFELVDPDEKFVMLEYGVGDKKGPLNVRVRRRGAIEPRP